MPRLLVLTLLLIFIGIHTQSEAVQLNCAGSKVSTDSDVHLVNQIGKQVNIIIGSVCPNNESSNYWKWIRVANKAKEKKDYQTAIINYERALAERPGDVYSTAMVKVMEKTIREGKAARAKKDFLLEMQLKS